MQQWRVVFLNGGKVAPFGSLFGAATWGYAAYTAYARTPSGSEWKAYAGASVFTLGTLAWTLLVMVPTNKMLMGFAGAVDSGSPVQAVAAIAALERWDRFNMVRAAIPLVGGLVGLIGSA